MAKDCQTPQEVVMLRREMILGTGLLALAACVPQRQVPVGSDGLPLPTLYRITEQDAREIPFRTLESVNVLRQAAGVGPVVLDPLLNAAAATHARDMSIQNRPWHFGSDGSSPIVRLARVGYTGRLVGEVISETFETENETLSAWMQDPNTRAVILNPAAARMGLAWLQEPQGKIWWTMVLAQ
jgi:uncharacterized protein YkwD